MKYVPASLTRLAGRTSLKLQAKSPTILVVTGVVGFGVTTALAISATRKLDPVLEDHRKRRYELEQTAYRDSKALSKDLVKVYAGTGISLAKIYGPTLVVGALSAAAVLSGHHILKGRHVATMAAYSGLAEEFRHYRTRVAQTLGDDQEKEIYDGAHGEWQDDPNHKGEQRRVMVYNDGEQGYLRPWYDETNVNWTRDPVANYLFLKGVQQHLNNVLRVKGHVFLNDAFDALGMDRCPEGAVAGWLRDGDGDKYIDFGFLASKDPHTIAFNNGVEKTVRLNFNIDGVIWDQI